MPQDKSLSGLICSKVSKVAKGLSHISTTIDPDWVGHLSISMHNHSDVDVELEVGEPFCTAVFLTNKSPATKSCGFAPSRTDTLVRAITTEQRIESIRRKRLKSISLIAALCFTALVLFVAMYLAFVEHGTDGKVNAAVVAGTMVGGSIISAVISAFLTRLIFLNR